MGIEHQPMKDLKLLELPEDFDPITMQSEMQEMVLGNLLAFGQDFSAVSAKQLFRGGEVERVIAANIRNIQMELAELTENLPWKYWKQEHQRARDTELTDEQIKEMIFEVIDVQHFIFNIAIVLGIDWETFQRVFYTKQMENRRRQETGY